MTDEMLTLNEAREYLETGKLPDNFSDRVALIVEFAVCSNCSGVKCMGCVFREYDHDCKDDCPNCC